MKAAVIIKPREIEIQEVPIPMILDDEVLIKIKGCGVCASNLAVWQGRSWFHYPCQPGSPGHESWGYVEQVGKGVQEFEEGDFVTGLTYAAFAEYDVAKKDHLLKLPDGLMGRIFPGEALGCAMNIFKRGDINTSLKGKWVVVIGIGFLGSLMIQKLKKAECRVIALSQRQSSLHQGEILGADAVIDFNDTHESIIKRVESITEGKLCERSFEMTGYERSLNLAAELTGIRGKIIIAGYHQDGLRQVNIQLWNWKGLDIINAHERDPKEYLAGIKLAIEEINQENIIPDSLYTHFFNLSEINQAFKLHDGREEGFIKGIILCD